MRGSFVDCTVVCNGAASGPKRSASSWNTRTSVPLAPVSVTLHVSPSTPDCTFASSIRMDGKEKRQGAAPAGRRASYKKAMVKLTADSKTIEFFEGMV